MKETLSLYFSVALGGALGSAARFFLSSKLNPLFPHFFWGTFLVNFTGSLALGFLLGIMAQRAVPLTWVVFLTAGFLGGFTTFSTFSAEVARLLTDGESFWAMLYFFASAFFGVGGAALGLWGAHLAASTPS